MRFQQMAPPPRTDTPKLQTNKDGDESGDSSGIKSSPLKGTKIADRNQRVNVQYKDGTVKRDIKFKNVEDDVVSGKAVLID